MRTRIEKQLNDLFCLESACLLLFICGVSGLWLGGFVGSYYLSGFCGLLMLGSLIFAVVLLPVRLIQKITMDGSEFWKSIISLVTIALFVLVLIVQPQNWISQLWFASSRDYLNQNGFLVLQGGNLATHPWPVKGYSIIEIDSTSVVLWFMPSSGRGMGEGFVYLENQNQLKSLQTKGYILRPMEAEWYYFIKPPPRE